MKKCVEMCEMLFKMWKCKFEIDNQTGPKPKILFKTIFISLFVFFFIYWKKEHKSMTEKKNKKNDEQYILKNQKYYNFYTFT